MFLFSFLTQFFSFDLAGVGFSILFLSDKGKGVFFSFIFFSLFFFSLMVLLVLCECDTFVLQLFKLLSFCFLDHLAATLCRAFSLF